MEKNLVVQSNKLIEAHYKQEYTVQEQRTVLWLMSEIHKHDYFEDKPYEDKELTITANDYAKIMDISVKNVYRDAKKITENLMTKVISVETEKGWQLFHWVSSMEYIKESGIMRAKISNDIIPYIIDLKEKFTIFRLENILNLKSKYAIKIYQLLSQYKNLKTKSFTLEELKNLLGISEKPTYKRFFELKKIILEVSKREINAKTDLTIDYEEIKKGKKVIALRFSIESKLSEEEELKMELENNIKDLEDNHPLKIAFENYGHEATEVKEAFKVFKRERKQKEKAFLKTVKEEEQKVSYSIPQGEPKETNSAPKKPKGKKQVVEEAEIAKGEPKKEGVKETKRGIFSKLFG